VVDFPKTEIADEKIRRVMPEAADVLGPTEKKTIVRDLLKSFETRDLAPMHYVDEAKYIQHNPKRRGRQGRTEEAPGATAGGYQDRDATAVGGR
jgi:hypothetical protein